MSIRKYRQRITATVVSSLLAFSGLSCAPTSSEGFDLSNQAHVSSQQLYYEALVSAAADQVNLHKYNYELALRDPNRQAERIALLMQATQRVVAMRHALRALGQWYVNAQTIERTLYDSLSDIVCWTGACFPGTQPPATYGFPALPSLACFSKHARLATIPADATQQLPDVSLSAELHGYVDTVYQVALGALHANSQSAPLCGQQVDQFIHNPVVDGDGNLVVAGAGEGVDFWQRLDDSQKAQVHQAAIEALRLSQAPAGETEDLIQQSVRELLSGVLSEYAAFPELQVPMGATSLSCEPQAALQRMQDHGTFIEVVEKDVESGITLTHSVQQHATEAFARMYEVHDCATGFLEDASSEEKRWDIALQLTRIPALVEAGAFSALQVPDQFPDVFGNPSEGPTQWAQSGSKYAQALNSVQVQDMAQIVLRWALFGSSIVAVSSLVFSWLAGPAVFLGLTAPGWLSLAGWAGMVSLGAGVGVAVADWHNAQWAGIKAAVCTDIQCLYDYLTAREEFIRSIRWAATDVLTEGAVRLIGGLPLLAMAASGMKGAKRGDDLKVILTASQRARRVLKLPEMEGAIRLRESMASGLKVDQVIRALFHYPHLQYLRNVLVKERTLPIMGGVRAADAAKLRAADISGGFLHVDPKGVAYVIVRDNDNFWLDFSLFVHELQHAAQQNGIFSGMIRSGILPSVEGGRTMFPSKTVNWIQNVSLAYAMENADEVNKIVDHRGAFLMIYSAWVKLVDEVFAWKMTHFNWDQLRTAQAPPGFPARPTQRLSVNNPRAGRDVDFNNQIDIAYYVAARYSHPELSGEMQRGMQFWLDQIEPVFQGHPDADRIVAKLLEHLPPGLARPESADFQLITPDWKARFGLSAAAITPVTLFRHGLDEQAGPGLTASEAALCGPFPHYSRDAHGYCLPSAGQLVREAGYAQENARCYPNGGPDMLHEPGWVKLEGTVSDANCQNVYVYTGCHPPMQPVATPSVNINTGEPITVTECRDYCINMVKAIGLFPEHEVLGNDSRPVGLGPDWISLGSSLDYGDCTVHLQRRPELKAPVPHPGPPN